MYLLSGDQNALPSRAIGRAARESSRRSHNPGTASAACALRALNASHLPSGDTERSHTPRALAESIRIELRVESAASSLRCSSSVERMATAKAITSTPEAHQ